MNISPDYLIERKRNKRQLAKWKILSLALILLIFIIINNRYFAIDNINTRTLSLGNYIASVQINDIITDDLAKIKKLASIEKNSQIKALIVNTLVSIFGFSCR